MSLGMNRREFLGVAGTLGVLGASRALFPRWMPRLAFRDQQQSGAPGDILVCIFLRGGMDGLSAVVPYAEGGHYYDARPTQAIAAPGDGINAAIDLDGQFGLHSALAPLKELYEEGDLAIVHATGSPDPTRSHFDAMAYMELGTPGSKNLHTGWIGRHLQTAAWQNQSPFRAVGMGSMVPTSMRGPVTPLALQSIVDFHFKGREDQARKLGQSLANLYTIDFTDAQLSSSAALVFETVETLQALDAANYVPAGGVIYPDDEYGLGLAQVAQLIQSGCRPGSRLRGPGRLGHPRIPGHGRWRLQRSARPAGPRPPCPLQRPGRADGARLGRRHERIWPDLAGKRQRRH